MPVVLVWVVRPPIEVPTEVRDTKVGPKVDLPDLTVELQLGCHMREEDRVNHDPKTCPVVKADSRQCDMVPCVQRVRLDRLHVPIEIIHEAAAVRCYDMELPILQLFPIVLRNLGLHSVQCPGKPNFGNKRN
jgi:hypothetical protein